MPRCARILLPEHIYHLTHRCHNGSFFLRFNTTRIEYRLRLWRAVRRFRITMLNYCITSNHTHLLVKVRQPARISTFMRHLEGEFASYYNRRKYRCGSCWNERYHSTLIEDGCHFWNCMFYIDLNMVRARVVDHPCHWRWGGYQEMSGRRRRYQILELPELLQLAGMSDLGTFTAWYENQLDQVLQTASRHREPHWTESIAVGSEAFVRRIAALSKQRKRLEIMALNDDTWYVRDPISNYYSLSKTQPGRNGLKP